jgi:asparagine synthase (glutamine-hydrolysing)
MCGIAGILKWDNSIVTEEAILSFTDSLKHRGPDGRGIWIHANQKIALGHRRLSILDLSEAGHQPQHSSDKRFTISYNGEVFNFIDLKKDLIQLGYHFYTNSDTEVVLNAWKEWGVDCLYKFNGMWAFAIWDDVNKSLTLCRDRFGIKPLYYCTGGNNQFSFASETYAFKYLDGYKREADPQKLNLALQSMFGMEGRGETPFKNLFAIPPGHYMTVSHTGERNLKRWWNTLEHLVEIPDTYEGCVHHLRYLLEDACRIRLRSDVPVATALSGGVDSSAVYAMTHLAGQNPGVSNERQANHWQHAFTASFPGADTDETEYAQMVAAHVGGNLTKIYQSFDTLADRIIQDTIQFDSIYLSPVSVASDLYKAMYQNGIRVSLDGHGVDEMAYGYGHSVKEAWQEEFLNSNLNYAEDLEITFSNLFSPNLRETMRNSLHTSLQETNTPPQQKSKARQLYETMVPQDIKRVYRYFRGSPTRPAAWLKPIKDHPPAFTQAPQKEKALFLEFHETTLPTLLRNFDRASMMAGIESRMPFMDYRIVCFLFSLPREYKLGHGYTKRIIRDAISPFLPNQIVYRTWKVGFNAPMTLWFSGPLKNWILDSVNSEAFLKNENWNGRAISEYVNTKFKSNTWGMEECMQLWPYLSAQEILKK